MKIGIVALTDFRDFPTGGILTFVRRFVQAIDEMEHVDASLIGWSPDPRESTSNRVRVGLRDYEFLAIGHGRLHGALPDRAQFFMNRRRWKSVLDELGDVDAYYCHSPEAVLRVAQSGRGAPIALHIHGAINTVGRSRFALGRTRPVAALYEALVLGPALRASRAVFATVSDPDFRSLQRSGLVAKHALCVRVPAMVNRVPKTPTPAPPSREVRLACVGRLEPIKGVDLVIHSVARLRARGVSCRLRVIGDGTERQALEQLAKRLSVDSDVMFPGTLSELDVQHALVESDVFVSGSHQEGFSLALLEALAQGLPAVVTDVGSARDVVRNGATGYVVDNRDPDLFADRVLEAAQKAQTMKSHCIQAAEPYSSEAVSASIVAILRGMVENGSARPHGADEAALSEALS